MEGGVHTHTVSVRGDGRGCTHTHGVSERERGSVDIREGEGVQSI